SLSSASRPWTRTAHLSSRRRRRFHTRPIPPHTDATAGLALRARGASVPFERNAMADIDTFREETRAWLENNCPSSIRAPMAGDDVAVWGGRNYQFKSPEAKLWLERRGAKGWPAPMWPKEYGGGGLSNDENHVLQSEMRRIPARPPLFSFGIWML